MRYMLLLVVLAALMATAQGACAVSLGGVVVSGQAYYCWSDFWGSGWGPMFPQYSSQIESDPTDWLYALRLDDGIKFGLNDVRLGPRVVGAYEGYAIGFLSAGVSEFDFEVSAFDREPFGVDYRGNPFLRLEIWDCTSFDLNYVVFNDLLWSSTGPWWYTPQHFNVKVSDSQWGISCYALRIAVIPEPSSSAILAALVGLSAFIRRRG